MKKIWVVELVVNENVCYPIEIEAEKIIKVGYQEIVIDGVSWVLPDAVGLSFAEISTDLQNR